MDAPEVICGATAAMCFCRLAPGHAETVHECACGGAWSGSLGDDDFDVVRWPGSEASAS